MEQQHDSRGALIGSIIIILILIVGGIYFAKDARDTIRERSQMEEALLEDPDIQAQEFREVSDDLEALEQSLNSINVEAETQTETQVRG